MNPEAQAEALKVSRARRDEEWQKIRNPDVVTESKCLRITITWVVNWVINFGKHDFKIMVDPKGIPSEPTFWLGL